MAVTEQGLLAALTSVQDPHTGQDFVSTRALRNVQIHGGDVAFDVELGYPAKSLLPELRRSLVAAAKGVAGVENVSVNITTKVVAHAVQRGVQLLPQVKNIIAVASGKGGVGKSTTAANLALALAAEGASVGVLDADIYGPSQPMMMGINRRPESDDGKTMEPLENYGVQVMSIGFLVDQDEAMIWRGPMATQALEQLLRQTNWKDLDYLIIDMPPGTGDIQLTLSQRVPMTGAVIVTTPQDIALLDADIYGPSQPMMLGISGQPKTLDGKSMEPMENHGLQVSSIGFMIDPDEPMVWRGPMVTQALQQLLDQTNWRDLDYLIVDMPPGTGDIQLTLSQKVPVTGAVIVTTPQDIALLDARKGLKMFEKVGIPILGVVENMSTHICSNCGHAEEIFGAGGGAKMCADFGVEFLGALPLTMAIRQQTDSGTPTVVAEPDGPVAAIYKQIARTIAIKVAEKAKDMTSKFPSIVIKND